MRKEDNNKKEKRIDEKHVEPQASSNTEPEGSCNCEKAPENELETLKKQLEEEKDRCLRLNAEFENQRKRLQKEKEEFVKYANEKLIIEFIDIMESLERGLENAKGSTDKDKLIQGMELIYKQLKIVLEKNGLVPIKALGEKFDPYKHEAMMQTRSHDEKEDMILEEFTRGYMLNNKVIRYSKVRVSRNKEADNENEVS